MLNTTVSLSPDHADAYDYLGQAYFKKEEYQDSVDSFNKALEIQPNHTRAKTNLGVAQWKLDSLNKTVSESVGNVEGVNQRTPQRIRSKFIVLKILEWVFEILLEGGGGDGGKD